MNDKADIGILIVEDDAQQRRHLAAILGALGYGARTAEGGRAALAALGGARRPAIALALIDLHLPDFNGIELIGRLRAAELRVPAIVLTSDDSTSHAVAAMRAGAADFIVKPVTPERLDVSIRNALAMTSLSREVERLTRDAENRLSFEDIVAVSPSIREVISLARRAARSDVPVLIEGESGTGKEVFARAVHGQGARAGAPFVAVNCGALPSALVESILFGHEKGAFTGAVERRRGKFQEASGGTLFLDEVGELPLEAQVKLLRAIQTGEVDPVGGAKPATVDIRLISATNRDLAAMVAEGSFREDLYYRISVFPLALPPLRERREDIPGLARAILVHAAAAEGRDIEGFSSAAMQAIGCAAWPGNVRQLQNTIRRAVILADGTQIRPEDLHGVAAAEPAAAPRLNGAAAPGSTGSTGERRASVPLVTEQGHIRRLRDLEADTIAEALRLYRGRMAEAARRLGIGRSTLYRKIDELRLDPKGE
ncbi:MAG TPA: sigma-54 dependent transcriptional regulator [Thermohalobaculum sp.]|nr:sigma-54 dependent transcriptional regulator [Thermohalobaculum sp.]